MLLYPAGMAGLLQNAMLHAFDTRQCVSPGASRYRTRRTVSGRCTMNAPLDPEAHNGDRAALQSQRSGAANGMECAERLDEGR